MRQLSDEVDILGECPTWDGRIGRLWWIDVTGKRIQSSAADGADRTSAAVDDYPGSFAPRSGGGRLIAFRRRLSLTDDAGNEVANVKPDAVDFAKERFNDGKCDSRGRFWVGSMDRSLKDTVGSLFRVDCDLTVHKVSTGYGISNGLAWSPDDTLLYHCDSSPTNIYVYDFDSVSGSVANRRIFATFDDGVSRPDGCAMDAQGYLWVAAPGAGCVRRFDPAGRIERSIETPTSFPSSVAFGGDDLRTLYITSLVPHELASPTDARVGIDGGVFATEVNGVHGWPVSQFGG